jgi:hypothetical protein
METPGPPVIVGISTLPSRIGKIRPAIDSLLENTRKPDKIVLTVPRRPLRGEAVLSIPDFLESPGYRDRLVVNVIEEDFGPGSKLMGCLGHVAAPCVVILADDDMEYRDFLVDRLYTRQIADRGKSFSFYAYRFGGMTIGQGADGFSIWSDNLSGIAAFYQVNVRGERIVFHDDLWISYFLLTRGVPVEGLQHELNGGLVYRSVHTDEALRDMDGELARGRLTTDGLRMLRERVPLSPSLGMKLAARDVADQVNSRIGRLAKRIFKR